MKSIIIFGASGRVGQKLVEYGIENKHKVTAFVRDMSKIKITSPNLEVISGDVFDSEGVIKAIEGKEIVISALSGRATKPDYSVLSAGVQNIINGMHKFNLTRFLNVAGAGILDDREFGLRRNRPNYPETFRLVSAENWKVYQYLQNSSINWTMVCAPEMPESGKTEIYRTAIDYLPDNGRRISVEDVADFILKNLDTKSIFKSRIGIAY